MSVFSKKSLKQRSSDAVSMFKDALDNLVAVNKEAEAEKESNKAIIAAMENANKELDVTVVSNEHMIHQISSILEPAPVEEKVQEEGKADD